MEESQSETDTEETVLKVLDESLTGELSDSSSTSKRSCAVISTIPKCSHLSSQISSETEEIPKSQKDLSEVTERLKKKPGKFKVFRSQSAFGDFDTTKVFEKNRPTNSHPDNFNCALNRNFPSGSITPTYDNGKCNSREDNVGTTVENVTPKLEQYPLFITESTNLGLRMDLKEYGGLDEMHTMGIGKAGACQYNCTNNYYYHSLYCFCKCFFFAISSITVWLSTDLLH